MRSRLVRVALHLRPSPAAPTADAHADSGCDADADADRGAVFGTDRNARRLAGTVSRT